MQSSLTAYDLFSNIILLRNVDHRSVIIVEGDSDCGLVDNHIDDRTCYSLPATSKDIATGAAGLAFDNGIARVVALVDRDWVGRIESPLAMVNVFYTDAYDLEATLFSSTAVRERVLTSFAKRIERLRVGDPESSQNPFRIATRAAAAVSAFRLSSIERGWGISVRDFPVHAIVDLSGADVDLSLMCRIAIQKANSTLAIDEAVRLIRPLYEQFKETPGECSGHDLMAALSYTMKANLGGSVSSDNLAAAFRACARCDDLYKTHFFEAMKRYASMNSFEVWRCPCP